LPYYLQFYQLELHLLRHRHKRIQPKRQQKQRLLKYGEPAKCAKTVKAEGVTTANWDEKTQMLTVSFDPKKSSVDVLSKKLASVGHDTEKYRAPDEVYAKLPGCCHYDRAK
jgi:hypothetical protein